MVPIFGITCLVLYCTVACYFFVRIIYTVKRGYFTVYIIRYYSTISKYSASNSLFGDTVYLSYHCIVSFFILSIFSMTLIKHGENIHRQKIKNVAFD